MSSASLVTVLGPSSFTSITVLHFITPADYLITLLMMPFKKNCRVFFSNPDNWTIVKSTKNKIDFVFSRQIYITQCVPTSFRWWVFSEILKLRQFRILKSFVKKNIRQIEWKFALLIFHEFFVFCHFDMVVCQIPVQNLLEHLVEQNSL